MRLFELLTEDPPTIKQHEYAGPLKNRARNLFNPSTSARGTKTLGAGVFSRVYGHDENPHEVVKLSWPHHQSGGDHYVEFVKEIAQNPSMQENPHFPRIRLLRRITSTIENTFEYIVRMERLVDFTKLTEDEYEMVCRSIFKSDYINQELFNIPDFQKSKQWRAIYHRWAELFVGSAEIPDKVYAKIDHNRARDLVSALRIIENLSEKYNARIDLHMQNFMFRRTQYGPVLVITDPLAGKRFG